MDLACGSSAVVWLQACSGAGKKEEAVRGMEQLCEVKAQAAGPNVVHTVQAAGVSLEARLQVRPCGPSFNLVSEGAGGTPRALCVGGHIGARQ